MVDPAGGATEPGVSAGDIGEDLGAEVFGGREAAFRAEAVEEVNGDLGGGVASEGFEEKGFDGEMGAVVGGAIADVGDGGPGAGGLVVVGSSDVDAIKGQGAVGVVE